MRVRLLILLRLAVLWFALQIVGRIGFIAYQVAWGEGISKADALMSMVHGARMDASFLGYLFALFILLFILGLPVLPRVFRSFFLWVNGIISVAVITVIVADFELFRNWQFRFDLTPFMYLTHPREALSSSPSWLVGLLVAGIAFLSIVFVFLCNRWAWPRDLRIRPPRWWFAPALLLLAGLMFLPIRGSLGVSPMAVSTVAFSPNTFANQAAINSVWHLIDELAYKDDMYTGDPAYMGPAEAKERFNALQRVEDSIPLQLLRIKRPNIILLLMESQSANHSSILSNGHSSPNLDSLAKEGVLFTQIYSAGDRSDKGLLAILAGYPAQPKNSLIKFTRKLSQLSFFPNTLDSLGYYNTFIYGGDASFANFRTALYLAGFHSIVEEDDFPKSQRNAKWGAHDEYTFTRLFQEADTAQGPFFKMLFTLTNHEPFQLPGERGRPTLSAEEAVLRTARYADSCMMDFIERSKRRPWWDSTLVVIVADHGHRYPGNSLPHSPTKFHIPLLLIGGALRDSVPHVIETIGTQMDFPAMLLGQLGLPHGEFIFSRDLLSTKRGHAFFAFNNGFGWVTPNCTFAFDHNSKTLIEETESCTDSIRKDGLSYFSYANAHYNGL